MKNVRGIIPPYLGQPARQLRVLEDTLRDCLPSDCCQHVRVAGFTGDALVLIARSAVWRSRLHFYSDRIIEYFRPLAKSPLERLRIRVDPGLAIAAPAPRREPPLQLPPAAARAFGELAASTDDPDLRRALERLAAHSDGTGEA